MKKSKQMWAFVKTSSIHQLLWIAVISLVFLVGCGVSQVSTHPTKEPSPTTAPAGEVIKPTVQTSPATFTPSPTPVPLSQYEPIHVAFDVSAQIGGTARAVALTDNAHAYIGIGPRLFLVDVADQREPKIIGQSDLLPGLVQAIVVEGQRAFVGAGSQLITMTVGEGKTMLNTAADLTLPGYLIQGMVLSGDTLYVTTLDCEETCAAGRLVTVDVSDHLHPYLVNAIELPAVPGDVTVAGAYLYVANSVQGIDIFEINSASEPHLVTTLATEAGVESLAVTGQLLFAGLGNGRVAIFDLSEPTAPQLLQETNPTGGVVEDLYDDGEKLYWTTVFCDVGLCHRGFHKMAIHNSAHTAEPSIEATGLAVIDGMVYAATENGLEIADWRAAEPLVIGDLELVGPVSRVAVSDNTVLVVGDRARLTAVDMSSEPTISSVFTSTQQCETCRFGFIDVEAAEDVVYLSAWADGLRAATLGDFAVLPELGTTAVTGDVRDLALVDNSLYTVGDDLHIWDASDPANLYKSGQFTGDWYGSALFVADNYAYVVTPYSGLRILDVTDPANLREIAQVEVATDLTSVAVTDRYAFVTSAACSYFCSGGLHVIDVSDPGQPFFIATLPVAKGVSDVIVRDGLAFLGLQDCGSGSCTGGLFVVDISDVTQLQEVFSLSLPGRVTDLAMDDNGKVYVATNNTGMFVLQRRP